MLKIYFSNNFNYKLNLSSIDIPFNLFNSIFLTSLLLKILYLPKNHNIFSYIKSIQLRGTVCNVRHCYKSKYFIYSLLRLLLPDCYDYYSNLSSCMSSKEPLSSWLNFQLRYGLSLVFIICTYYKTLHFFPIDLSNMAYTLISNIILS